MANLAVVRTLQAQIHGIETVLHRTVKLRPEFSILKTAPGIGETLATTIMLETGSNLTTSLRPSFRLAFNELTKAHSDSYLSRALVLFIAPEFPSRAACSR
jgi:transposase